MEKQEVMLNLEQDVHEIRQLIWDYVEQKYIVGIKNKVDGYRSECENNLGKEAQLIQAIMPFLPEEKTVLQLVLDVMVYNEIIEKNLQEHQEITAFYRDENKEKEQLKKFVYKLVMIKLLMTIDEIAKV